MTDKKPTDKEIIKALECVSGKAKDWDCDKCPFDSAICLSFVAEKSLDLINRLQSENERLLQNLQQPQVEAENKNIVHCKECKHLMFSDFEGECSKGYKGIVRPNDSCPFGVRERGESK